jgi:protoporphyrinogen oxidase
MKTSDQKAINRRVIIIGAGPAGLTAAYELCKAGVESVVVEKDTIVGGLARTVNFNGYLFDIGGHRFFTKVKPIEEMWNEVLGPDFIKRNRLSRIYHNKKFYYYPFRISNALLNLGIGNSILVLISYFKSQLFPRRPELTFEQWVSNRFGKRLYEIFFKTYTEKVWGISCSEISADWASQRIKGLSLFTALRAALLNQKNNAQENSIKTLIDSFHYPRYGPGMMWNEVKNRVMNDGGEVILGADVEKIYLSDDRVTGLQINKGRESELISGTHYISSMPVRELINKLSPPAPKPVREAATSLNYRDFLTVILIINKKEVFQDNWIYIHDPDVRMGRIQNFKNWSPDMVPDQNKTCLGLEYFCFEGDGLWTMSDEDLIELGKAELGSLGIADKSLVESGTVVRMPKAYPVYDSTYLESLELIKQFLSTFGNLQLVGRNGMHKYNNQDHSMLTAMLAVRNILGSNYDLWLVNTDKEYHEDISGTETIDVDELSTLGGTQPSHPRLVTMKDERLASFDLLIKAFAKMDKFAFALAVGSASGLAILVSTLWLTLTGVESRDPDFILLGQYFIGYTVSIRGAVVGLGYCFLWGFIFGWLYAYLRNLSISGYLHWVKRQAESRSFKDFLDYI